MSMLMGPAYKKAATATGAHSWLKWDAQSLPQRAYLHVGWVTALGIGNPAGFYYLESGRESQQASCNGCMQLKSRGGKHLSECLQVFLITGCITFCLTFEGFFVLVTPVGLLVPCDLEQSTSQSSRQRSNSNFLKFLAVFWRSLFFWAEWLLLG